MTKILVLEDEPAVMKLMQDMLRQHNALPAATWEEAMQHYNHNAGSVDLLVADLTIAVHSGVQVAQLMRQDNPGLPVILMSGYPVGSWSPRDTGDLEKLGTDSVVILQKPFQRRQLLDAVRRLTVGEAAGAG